jgi:hypothetical protein
MIVTGRLKIKKGRKIVVVVGAAMFVVSYWKTLETEEVVKLRLNITGHRRVNISVDGV